MGHSSATAVRKPLGKEVHSEDCEVCALCGQRLALIICSAGCNATADCCSHDGVQAACRCRSVWRSGPVLQLMRSLLNGSVSIGVGAGLHDRPAQRSRRSGVLVGTGLFAAGGVGALAAGYLLTLALLDALHPAH